MTLAAPELESALSELSASEGRIAHLYLDTAGLVTVGVGECLETLEEAQALAFVHRDSGREASKSDIERDWDAVRKEPAGRVAGRYASVTQLELPATEIDRLLERRVIEFSDGLERQFNGFELMPRNARLALLDMAFNLGLRGLRTKFPKFSAACQRGDWVAAAVESKRRGVGAGRNARVRGWLEELGR